VVEQLDKISLSFLVDDLEVRRGGVAANISFAMAGVGLRPLLVGAVGADFAEYRSWLDRHGVDTGHVRVSELKHTARFICTTDRDQAQIASFYAGAMSEAREIELAPLSERVGGLDLVLIGANDPEAMLRHTDECRDRGYAFVADPSQQLAFSDGASIRRLVEGATYLFTNEYEAALTEQKTGWSADEVLSVVGTRVTRSARAVCGSRPRASRLSRSGLRASCARPTRPALVTPSGAASSPACRGACRTSGCAQIGSMLATYVIETVGTQEYELTHSGFLQRLEEAFGEQPAADVAAHLRTARP
jgi:adenosine kinase